MGVGPLFLGIDIGTSGIRLAAINEAGSPQGSASVSMPAPLVDGVLIRQDPAVWLEGLDAAFQMLRGSIPMAQIRALAVDGTSGTILGVDSQGRPIAPARMYHEASARDEALMIGAVAPLETAAHGVTSPLGKAIRLMNEEFGLVRVIHQADFISGQFSGAFGVSDENNALKTGYDPVARQWPRWIGEAGMPVSLLPRVVPAGTTIGHVTPLAAERFGLEAGTAVVAGTTDGCASFLATGADQPGDCVTSLGSTLVVKLLSDRPIFAPEYGIYSHRIGETWLVGGASNAGGAVIANFFDRAQIKKLEPALRPDRPTGLHYYPLSKPGERFPMADPDMQPVLEPRPKSDARFLQAILEGLSRIEAEGYARLQQLGAPSLRSMRTVGGGATNRAWTRIRQRLIDVPFLPSASEEAAIGVARLALQGWQRL